MSESSSSPEAGKVSSSTTGVKTVAAKKPVAKPLHPNTAEMVMNAIGTLKERKGSSLLAIKKFVATEYDLDAEKQAIYIKKFLKKAVESGDLIQTSGTGATGSFRLPKKSDSKPKVETSESAEEPAKKVAKKTKAAEKTESAKKADSVKKTVSKKSTESKKTAESKKPTKAAEAKKMAKTTQAKSPSKVKKTAKSPTKPKAPRAKKTTSPLKAKAMKN